MPERRRELDVSLLLKLPRHLLIEPVIRPVGAAVDGPLLVIELRVEQHQAIKLAQPFGRVVRADTTCEARAEQAQTPGASRFLHVLKRHPDVVEYGSERQLFLAALTLTVTAEVKAQGRHASLTKPASKPREEAALLAGNTATVYQDHSMPGLSVGCDECGSQSEAVEGAESYGLAQHGHAGSPSVGCAGSHTPRTGDAQQYLLPRNVICPGNCKAPLNGRI